MVLVRTAVFPENLLVLIAVSNNKKDASSPCTQYNNTHGIATTPKAPLKKSLTAFPITDAMVSVEVAF